MKKSTQRPLPGMKQAKGLWMLYFERDHESQTVMRRIPLAEEISSATYYRTAPFHKRYSTEKGIYFACDDYGRPFSDATILSLIADFESGRYTVISFIKPKNRKARIR